MNKPNPPLPGLITTTEELEAISIAFAKEPFITVDTEFMRESTYYPILCLIQISSANNNALIDPLADGIELDAFYQLMADEKVTKVFHAARQDIEIIFTQAGIIPKPLFDTQIAAMVCGFGDSVGYENLIRTLLNEGIDKTSRFTDWSKRPLSEKQLTYALADVTHLYEAYPLLKRKIEETGRTQWVEQEMNILENPATYATVPEEAYRRLKFNANNKRARAVFMEIAAWREREAQTRNVPRNRVMKDDGLRELAQQRPRNLEALANLRAVHKGFAKSHHASALLAAIKKGMDKPDSDIFPAPKAGPPRAEIAPISEMLKVLLKIICEQHDVAPKLIASSADIEKIAYDNEADVPALKGWRRELFGDKALALKQGKLALTLEDGAPALIGRE